MVPYGAAPCSYMRYTCSFVYTAAPNRLLKQYREITTKHNFLNHISC